MIVKTTRKIDARQTFDLIKTELKSYLFSFLSNHSCSICFCIKSITLLVRYFSMVTDKTNTICAVKNRNSTFYQVSVIST